MKPAPRSLGIEPYAELGPDLSKPRGAGGLRNPVLELTGPYPSISLIDLDKGARLAEIGRHCESYYESVSNRRLT